MLRKILIAFAGLVVLVVLLAAGARWYVGRAEADPSRDATLSGLGGEVEVWRDSLAVPHVWAKDEAATV